jgi:hypothetical protein
MIDKKQFFNTNMPGWIKNPATGIVINTNEYEYIIYKEKIASFLNTKSLETDVIAMKAELAFLKDTLTKVLDGRNNVQNNK